MTTPPRKHSKRDYSTVEKSPDIDRKLSDVKIELKDFVLTTYEKLLGKVHNLMDEDVTDNFAKLKKDILGELTQLVTDISNIKEHQHNVSSTQQDLSTRLNRLEQDKLNNSIEISGLSPAVTKSNKSASEIAAQVLKIYNVNDFQSAYKRHFTINSEQKTLLVVTFKTYEEKMKALNMKRTMDTGKKCNVFFNHSLTKFNRSLYMRARFIAKSINLKVAISYGRVFVRNPDEKFGVHIKSEKELEIIKERRGIGNRTQSNAT